MAGNKIVAKLGTHKLSSNLNSQSLSAQFNKRSVAMIKDHNLLDNLEYLKSGHTGFAGIEFGTTAEWNANPSYRPPEGMLTVYTDYKTKVNPDTGEITYIANFKIGDGNAYLIDKEFVGDDVREALLEHIEDTGLHIQPGERAFWNNKLNYVEPEDDLLEFTRD